MPGLMYKKSIFIASAVTTPHLAGGGGATSTSQITESCSKGGLSKFAIPALVQ